MPDCFISYSSQDQQLADLLYGELTGAGLTIFMAGASLKPGDDWSAVVWSNLRSAELVLFLASKAACASPFVQQELGHALGATKRLIPVVWDMDPAALPGWVNCAQALNLQGMTLPEPKAKMLEVAESIKAPRRSALLALGAIVAAILVFGNES